MATAYFRKIDPITEDQILGIVKRAVEGEALARQSYESACIISGISDDDRSSGECGMLVYGGGWNQVRVHWIRLKKAIDNTIEARERAAKTLARDGSVVIDVIGGYDIHETLKTNGYKFTCVKSEFDERMLQVWRKEVGLGEWKAEAEMLISNGVEVKRR